MRLPLPLQRPAALLAPLAYMGAIFWQSSIEMPIPPEVLPDNFDKVLHLAEYGVLGFLLQRGIAVGLARPRLGWWIAALIGALYGLSDEFHQLHVAGRDASWGDAAADLVGSILGAWVGCRAFERQPGTKLG